MLGEKNVLLMIFFLSILSFNVNSQDTTKTKPAAPEKKTELPHCSPTKAMMFSAVVPGLGQAYNKTYWKIPIVYASMSTTLYFFNYNHKLYKNYKQAYVHKTDSDNNTIDPYPAYTPEDLKELSSYYRRYRDLNIILTGLFYTLNVIDAYVDAQLKTFDVSDNLSFNIYPAFILANKNPITLGCFNITF